MSLETFAIYLSGAVIGAVVLTIVIPAFESAERHLVRRLMRRTSVRVSLSPSARREVAQRAKAPDKEALERALVA
jgi:hypothetical protein